MGAVTIKRTRNSFLRLTFRQRTYVIAILLLIPALALRTFTAFYPFIQTAYLSLHNYNPAFDGRMHNYFYLQPPACHD